MSPQPTVAQTLRSATHALTAAAVPSAARDARVLLAHVVGVAPTRLTLMGPDEVSAADLQTYKTLIERRTARQPVSHLIGTRAFFGRMFHVTADVLDPRPETEMLIETALSLNWSRVLDLGTGSGAILLTLLAERSSATGCGVDISAAALQVAHQNAQAFGVAARADLAVGDWAADITDRFDLVVCNPPYISQSEYDALEPEPRLWEPALALTPGGDGLAAYRIVVDQLSAVLAPQGSVLFEIGPSQANAVCDLLALAGLTNLGVMQDLDGRDRVVRGQIDA